LVLSLPMLRPGELPADLIRLDNGGELRGEFRGPVSRESESVVEIITWTGARVIVARPDTQFLTVRSQKLEEYETRAKQRPATVEACWELAEWCRTQGLSRQRSEQLEQLLAIDPQHEDAHRGLGHTFQQGRWMTRHEEMTARGYVRHGNRYVTQQELDLLQKSEAQREAEQAWFPRVRLWLGWSLGNHAARRAEGLEKFRAIRDPDAVAAIVNFLATHEQADVRRLGVEVLGQLTGSRPVGPLVARSLEDPDSDVRRTAFQTLDPDQHAEARARYAAALSHELNVVVRRAAVALKDVGDATVVPALIEALVTAHRYRVTYKELTPSYAVGSDGSLGLVSPGEIWLPPDVDLALRTGQLPYGVVVQPPPQSGVLKTTTVQRHERNPEVLSALKHLTGRDFGYDERTWQLWRASE
jgi:hypothetical protein